MRQIIAVLALCAALAAFGAPGDVEVRAYTAIAPQFAENWGAGAALEVWTVPDDWAVIGGRIVFADAVYLSDATALGFSISVTPAESDFGLRAFAVGWLGADKGGNWCVGLSQKLTSW